jgi:hypothetical protein
MSAGRAALTGRYFSPEDGNLLRILEENEWRGIGITQSLGWEHFEVHGESPVPSGRGLAWLGVTGGVETTSEGVEEDMRLGWGPGQWERGAGLWERGAGDCSCKTAGPSPQ